MTQAPSELEGWYRLYLHGRGDVVDPLFSCLRGDRNERTGKRAWAALVLSRIYILRGSMSLAGSYIALSSRLFNEAGSGKRPLGLLVNRALILKNQGSLDRAENLLRRIFSLSIQASDIHSAAKAASNLSVVLIHRERADEADSYLTFAREAYRELGLEREYALTGLTEAILVARREGGEAAIDRLSVCITECDAADFGREGLIGRLLMAGQWIGLGDCKRAGIVLDAARATGASCLERFRPLDLASRHLQRIVVERQACAPVYRLGVESRGFGRTEEAFVPFSLCPRETADEVSVHAIGPGAASFITGDPCCRSLLDEMKRSAPLLLPVLIEGESGVGKELLARLMHRWSGRGERPFMPVNVAALPRELFESALFGHRRGAFTGAVAARPGLIEAAGDGTLFLDEIGELDPSLQAKLLRTLDRNEYIPVGGTDIRRCRARIVAATNSDLEAAVASGGFRKDLFHRLSVLSFRVPPLRERRSDILLLAVDILGRITARYRFGPIRLGEGAAAILERYDWPGNVRELEHELTRAVVRVRRGVLRVFHLSAHLVSALGSPVRPRRPATLDERMWELQRREIITALKCTAGNIARAADSLGIKRTTLIYRMKRLGIE
ncbi:MAG: sigma 54-interacting transcriptional regulator [bacterium]|nr:MAG: sigma 54-interacting transcriptional regulator [bacterium]